MSEPEIPFLLELRREFRRVAVAQTGLAPPRLLTRRRAWKVLPALLLVCAGAAAARSLLFVPTPTRLVADGLQCVAGTSNRAKTSLVDVEPDGLTPAQACGRVLRRSAAGLIACQDARYGTVVYEKSGAVDQCRVLKLLPLPPGYERATRRVHQLQVDLNRVYSRHGCLRPGRLAARAQGVLDRLHFVGWRTLISAFGAPSQGPCGQFVLAADGLSNADESTLGHGDVVVVEDGPPRAIAALLLHEQPTLAAASRRSCHTTAQAETLARRAFAAHGLSTRFALTREPTGEEFPGQTDYARGCTVIIEPTTAPDGHTVLIWLIARSGVRFPTGVGIPTLGMYRPAGQAPRSSRIHPGERSTGVEATRRPPRLSAGADGPPAACARALERGSGQGGRPPDWSRHRHVRAPRR